MSDAKTPADVPAVPPAAARRLVRTFFRARDGARQTLHGIGRVRPPSCRSRHRRLPRPRPHAGRHGHPAEGGPGRYRARPRHHRGRDRAAHVCVVGRFRGCPSQHREAADGVGRRRRQAAAHRTFAQRPGGHRRAPVVAGVHRRAGRPGARTASRTSRPGRAPRRHDHAGIHAPAAGATGDVRPSPHGVRRDVDARRRTPRRLPQARQPAAAGRGGARRNLVSDRPRAGRRRAGIRGAVHQFAGRRRRPRLRDRIRRRRRAHHGAPVAVRGGARAVVESALRIRDVSPTASAPAARSCRRKRIRMCRSWCAGRAAA